jgi:ABC-2 type transport system ATP-binding protein
LFFALAKVGYPILELKSMDMTLEDIFLQIVTQEKEVM